MDFELDAEQRAIVEAVDALLERHAGPRRAIELAAKAGYDSELDAALDEAGFLSLARESGPLEAALLVEACARAGAVSAVGAAALVAPLVCDEPLPGPIALLDASSGAPARYAAHARTLLVLDGPVGSVVSPASGDVEPVASSFGFPMGRALPSVLRAGPQRVSGSHLRDVWRVALAAELAGTLSSALDTTLDYVKRRRQFGRAIGSFQAVQQRLAQCAVWVAGARWLALEAAFRNADSESAAVAAAHASWVAERVFAECHQFSGAMGFTREHDLHVFSLRLQALRLELDGVTGHRAAAAAARWVLV